MINMMGFPGAEAAVGSSLTGPDSASLVLFLDPENVSIQPASGPDGPAVMARFMRAIEYNAGLVATYLENLEAQSRHALPEGQQEQAQVGLQQWFSESGAGGFDPSWPE